MNWKQCMYFHLFYRKVTETSTYCILTVNLLYTVISLYLILYFFCISTKNTDMFPIHIFTVISLYFQRITGFCIQCGSLQVPSWTLILCAIWREACKQRCICIQKNKPYLWTLKARCWMHTEPLKAALDRSWSLPQEVI